MQTQKTPRSMSLPKRLWTGFVRIFKRPLEMMLGGVVIAGLIVFAGGVKIWNKIESNDAALRERDRVEQEAQRAEDAFANLHGDWVRASDLFNSCVARIKGAEETTEHLRGTLFAMADLSDLFPDADLATQYTLTRQAIIDVGIPPVDVEARTARDCVQPGPEPQRPPTATGG